MKVAPVTITQAAMVAAGLTAAYLAWTAYQKLSTVTADKVVAAAASAVDQRSDVSSTLGSAQSWVDATVQKGEATSTTFIGSFFTGLFK